MPSSAPHQLLVEGRDDVYAVIGLTSRHGLDWEHPKPGYPFLRDCEGVEQILEQATIAGKSYQRVGIMLDADERPLRRWTSLRDRLNAIGVSLPAKPVAGGWIGPGMGEGRRIGVWMMPDNATKGILEDFLATLVPSSDVVFPYAKKATAEVKKLGARYLLKDRSKAEIHAWLAWQEAPGRPFGQALTAAYFDTETPQALSFLAWFNGLYGLAATDVVTP